MEDAHVTNMNLGDGNMLYCVFDGHGGREVARFAAKHFASMLTEHAAYQSGDYEKALDATFMGMDKRIEKNMGDVWEHRLGYDPNFPPMPHEKSTAGATATVLLMTKDEMICANAGDARTVLCKSGKAIDLSHDNKPDDEEEKARIEKVGGHVMYGRVNG